MTLSSFEALVSRTFSRLEVPSPPQSLQPPRLDSVSNRDLAAYFANTWNLYEWLLGAITGEGAFHRNPDPLRNDLIFYLGHTASFYINKMVAAGLLGEGLNPRLEALFARGVDPESPDQLSRPPWPETEEVWAYRKQVFQTIASLIETSDIPEPITEEDPWWSLLMGLEHERIHFETSSVLIRQLDPDMLSRPEGWHYAPLMGKVQEVEMIWVPPGEAVLGKPREEPIYGWDNEYGQKTVAVPGFEASRNLVTNAEFLPFIAGGGYNERKYWTEEGWRWKCSVAAGHPRFWVPDGNRFLYRAIFDILELPPYWPVEVNCFEAQAFCRWLGNGHRLLSEAEFQRIAAPTLERGEDPAFSNRFNLNMRLGSPSPVGHFPEAESPLGFNDVYGNVWVWLSNDFHPLPDFETHYLYDDFSTPFFDEDHAMLLGGSWATTGTGASKYYRLWFRRCFYQHAGFRLARSPRRD